MADFDNDFGGKGLRCCHRSRIGFSQSWTWATSWRRWCRQTRRSWSTWRRRCRSACKSSSTSSPARPPTSANVRSARQSTAMTCSGWWPLWASRITWSLSKATSSASEKLKERRPWLPSRKLSHPSLPRIKIWGYSWKLTCGASMEAGSLSFNEVL